MRRFVVFFLCISCLLGASNPSAFNYDLNVSSISGSNSRTLICMHGFGMNSQMAQSIKELNVTESTLITFNFPEYDFKKRNLSSPRKVSAGSIRELLPVLHVLKCQVVDEKKETIDLYGFSAGGGALINMLAVLNSDRFDEELKKIGIGPEQKQQILSAVQKGVILLDSPLKSMDEVMSHRGFSFRLWYLSHRYKKNQMRPLNALEGLKGLSLNVILYFQHPDEMLSNRDDGLYAEKLLEVNELGTTTVLIGDEGGHFASHGALWQEYGF